MSRLLRATGDNPPMRPGATASPLSRGKAWRRDGVPATRPSGGPAPRRIPLGLLLLFLALLPLAAFWPVLRSDFVSYDDDVYVVRNPTVLRGLTFPGVRWALTTGHGANWHPLT